MIVCGVGCVYDGVVLVLSYVVRWWVYMIVWCWCICVMNGVVCVVCDVMGTVGCY